MGLPEDKIVKEPFAARTVPPETGLSIKRMSDLLALSSFDRSSFRYAAGTVEHIIKVAFVGRAEIHIRVDSCSNILISVPLMAPFS